MTIATKTDLVITVLDTATIYEAAEAVYRYDLPGTAVVEGSALAGVIAQAEKMLYSAWPQVTVEVVADSSGGAATHEAVKIIRRQLRVHEVTVADAQPAHAQPRGAARGRHRIQSGHPGGVHSAPTLDDAHTGDGREDYNGYDNYDDYDDYDNADGYGEYADAAPRTQDLQPLRRPVDVKQQLWRRIDPIWFAIAALVLVAAGGALWLTSFKTPAAKPVADVVASSTATSTAPTAPTTAAASSAPNSAAAEPATKEISAAGITVTLPAAFSVENNDGVLTATGADPHLRIIMAADPVFEVPAEVLMAEIHDQIASDDTLSAPAEAHGRLTYLERPGDDSSVTWTTWVEGDHQISVGCHTRFEPTLVQRAACRMAVDSIRKTAPST